MTIEWSGSIDLVAEEVGISTRQLERLFKRYFNITPHAYMKTLRLERARCLLQQTQMSVTSVAIACGFSGQSAFSKRYKLHFGIFPTAEMIALRHWGWGCWGHCQDKPLCLTEWWILASEPFQISIISLFQNQPWDHPTCSYALFQVFVCLSGAKHCVPPLVVDTVFDPK